MSLVSRYIVDNLIDAHHPTFNSTYCVNRKQRRLPCTICKDICPSHVYQQKRGEPPAWSHCSNCNLCVSACPSRCMTPAGDTLERYLEGYDGSGVVRIGCWKEQEICKIKEQCVAAVPWEFIAYLALRMKVEVFVRGCADCSNETGKKLCQDNLTRAQKFLKETPWEANLTMIRSEEDIPVHDEQSYSRRELLTKMKNNMLLAAVKLVPRLEEEDVDGFVFRRLLARQTQVIYDQLTAQNQQEAQDPSEPQNGSDAQSKSVSKPAKIPFTVQMPKLTANCYACGTCAMFCPQEAISMGEEVEGKRAVRITPWKCTACGVCTAVCRENGMNGMAYYKVPHMQQILLAKVPSASCENCGKAVDPKKEKKLCVLCELNQKKKR